MRRKLGLAIFLFLGIQASLSYAGEKDFSKILTAKVMAYHGQHEDFSFFNYTRPRASKEWIFSKEDFTQYLVNQKFMIEGLLQAFLAYNNKSKTQAEWSSEVQTWIKTLSDGLLLDLSQEHNYVALLSSNPLLLSPSDEAKIYLWHLENTRWQNDPTYLLISAYTLIFGHAFGAQNFLKRANELGLGQSINSRAFPTDKNAMGKSIKAYIDASFRNNKQTDEKKTESYLEYLVLEFVIQGSSLRVLDKAMATLDVRSFSQKYIEFLSK